MGSVFLPCVQSTTAMEELPCEMVENILRFLSLPSLCMMWSVSRRMREMIQSGISTFFRDIRLDKILNYVQEHGKSDLTDFLITLPQVDPNTEVLFKRYGESILHMLTHQGKHNCIGTLLQHPAVEVNKTDKWGKTALHKACREGHKIITKLLLQHHDINVNAQDNLGQTALHIAVAEDMHEIVDILLRDVLHTPRTFYCKERSHTIYLKQLQQIPYFHQKKENMKFKVYENANSRTTPQKYFKPIKLLI